MNNIIKNNFKLLDWDFKNLSTKDSFPHNICWYPSRYIPQIPAMLINELSEEGECVFDPFCGSGTTLIEAVRLKRSCIGADVNPIATFMTDVKLRLLKKREFDKDDVLNILDDIEAKKAQLGIVKYRLYDLFESEVITELESWYHEDTLSDLFIIWEQIEKRDGFLKDVLTLVFIAILMPSSGLESKRPYTYYADRVKPKEVLLKKDSIKNFATKLNRLILGMDKDIFGNLEFEFQCRSMDVKKESLAEFGKYDLVVTSPPYLNVTDYSTGFRLAYLWYPFVADLNALKNQEIGARSKRKRKNSLELYLSEMINVLSKVVTSLKEGGYICLVIGESTKYQNMIIDPLSVHLTNVLGLNKESYNERSVNQNYFLHPQGGVKKEEILVYRK